MTSFPDWRLDWIDDRLSVGRSINRYELMDLFGISYMAATTDIQKFIRLYTVSTDHGPLPPMWYDTRAQCYLPTRPYRSRRDSTRERRNAWRHLNGHTVARKNPDTNATGALK